MAEVEDRARLEGGGERPDVDEDLRETVKQTDRNAIAATGPTCSPTASHLIAQMSRRHLGKLPLRSG